MDFILIVVYQSSFLCFFFLFFFQAEDGIRDAQESRGLGDVYKRQIVNRYDPPQAVGIDRLVNAVTVEKEYGLPACVVDLSLIHI